MIRPTIKPTAHLLFFIDSKVDFRFITHKERNSLETLLKQFGNTFNKKAMTVLAKKEIRSIIGFSDRKTFNNHILRAGIKSKLPAWYWLRYCFYDDEIILLEGIFNHKLIIA